MPNVRYEELRPHQIVEAREACPLAWLPIGANEVAIAARTAQIAEEMGLSCASQPS